jgi:outer membrane receptor protein involved in Fe transport
MKMLLFFGALWLFSSACAAQSQFQIQGSVTDATKAALPNAVLKVVNLASGKEASARTDNAGQYTIKGLTSGIYRISVQAPGFASAAATRILHRVGRANITQYFSLVPSALTDTATITAGKGSLRAAEDTPQLVSVTTAQEIQRQRPASTLQALERTPNLIQAGVNPSIGRPPLRGLASSRVLIVIDGERLNNVRTDSGSTGISPSIVDVSQLDAVEVLSSAGSSLYGSDTLAGTVNL